MTGDAHVNERRGGSGRNEPLTPLPTRAPQVMDFAARGARPAGVTDIYK